MLLVIAMGDKAGLKRVAAAAAGKYLCLYSTGVLIVAVEKARANNLAFAASFQCGDTRACVDLLVKTDRAPEAALFARTYALK